MVPSRVTTPIPILLAEPSNPRAIIRFPISFSLSIIYQTPSQEEEKNKKAFSLYLEEEEEGDKNCNVGFWKKGNVSRRRR